ncbi:MAG TPA: AarF/ABC1/UbiB kinase family protein [Phycisphaerae bacterium]|nr:AarF/ABC1/UbiB kinase family protein [Phycisphaerae bacterium]
MSGQSDPQNRLDDWLGPGTIETLVPDCYAAYRLLIADALQYFLSRFSRKRWGEIVGEQTEETSGLSAAVRFVQLLHACPTLHKLGQVVARHRALDADFRTHLQRLESFEPKTPLSAVQPIINDEMAEAIECYDIQFEPRALAEASVAVVMACTWSPGGGHPRRRAALKVLKPGVAARLEEELAIIADLADYLDDRRAACDLPDFAYRDTFDTVRDVLASEVRFEIEQNNLRLAATRYAHREDVIIPEVLPFSMPGVTAMEYIDGVKATQVGSLTAGQRRSLARTIIDALVGDAVFSSEPETIFHADPHAGNLLAVSGGGLGILDWSLTGRLTKVQQEIIARIIFAAMRLDAAEVCRAATSLAASPVDDSMVRGTVDGAIDEIVRGKVPGPSWLARLLDALAIAGTRFPMDLMLFRKTILIVEGVVADVDPHLSLDAALITRAVWEFGAEWPMRMLASPTSRSSTTHISNIDFARLGAAWPASAMNYWLRSWSAWMSR